MQSQILTWITFLPLIGMAVILLMPKTSMNAIKGVSLAATFVTMVLGTWLYFSGFEQRSLAEIESAIGQSLPRVALRGFDTGLDENGREVGAPPRRPDDRRGPPRRHNGR